MTGLIRGLGTDKKGGQRDKKLPGKVSQERRYKPANPGNERSLWSKSRGRWQRG